ncbi:MAG: MauE/DoxX family redox-associated membrane protein [Myxococcales bacterium]|nr:DoxX family membrane protein [Myxococcota bacterium]MDW8280659.1 MauE/DoxX family redox-associated membrane protein [Myxococcales bacterium]
MQRLRPALILALRVGLGGLLLYAAASKWRAPQELAETVANYRLLPAALSPMGAVALLGTETVVGGLLLAGVWMREVALLCTMLFALFCAAVASALVRGLRIDCGCFGAGGSPATVVTLMRDLCLLGASGLLLWLSRPGRAGDAATASTQTPPGPVAG